MSDLKQPTSGVSSPAPAGSALLPCPFCGGEADFHERKSGGHFVECSKCWASSRLIFAEKVDARRELSESWNARREGRLTKKLTGSPGESADNTQSVPGPTLAGAAGSAITYIGQGPKGPHVIYLREGIRITVGRDKSTKGPAWLVVEDTPVVKAQSPNAQRERPAEDGQ